MSLQNQPAATAQQTAGAADGGSGLLLALFSAAVLAFEVFLTKLLSYSVLSFLLYAVLGIAMLGFGAAGSLVALRSRWLAPENIDKALAFSAVGFVAALFGSLAIFVRLTHLVRTPGAAMGFAVLLTPAFLVGGLVITLALSSKRSFGRTYAANLLGSGLGCFLPALLLRPLGGERFLVLTGLLAWVCAVGYSYRLGKDAPRALWVVVALELAVCIFGFALPEKFFPIQPEPEPLGQVDKINNFATARGGGITKLYDRWNPTGRIQIYQYERMPGGPAELPEADTSPSAGPYPFMFYAQDSSNGSILVKWDGRDHTQEAPALGKPGSELPRLCTQTLFGTGYYQPRKRSLTIGLGGGPDVQCALYYGVGSVDVAEINPDSVAAVRGPFNEWLGGIGQDPRVHYHVRDGRSFARAARGGNYDLITLSGVDTKFGLASGALALSENQLYTHEAFVDYLSGLSERGVVSILRFNEWEALRLSATAISALRTLGVAHPERHIAIIKNDWLFSVLVQRSPFDAADVRAVRARYSPDDRSFVGAYIWFYEIFNFPLRTRPEIVHIPLEHGVGLIGAYFNAVSSGKEREFLDLYPLDIRPTSDNRPFFFDVGRYDRPGAWQAEHVLILRNLLGTVVLLSIVLILVPVWRLRVRGSSDMLRALAFFASIGLAYMFVEVWLLHRLGMFLGHQTLALMVVLAALLMSSGVGAASAERIRLGARPRVVLAVAVIVSMVAFGHFVLPPLLITLSDASFVTRVVVTFVYVAPLGFVMGLPFPAGLAWIRALDPASVPWCVGINACASVLATVAVVPIAVASGYSMVALAGAGLYCLTALVVAGMRAPATK
jgi:hypothetical protein